MDSNAEFRPSDKIYEQMLWAYKNWKGCSLGQVPKWADTYIHLLKEWHSCIEEENEKSA